MLPNKSPPHQTNLLPDDDIKSGLETAMPQK